MEPVFELLERDVVEFGELAEAEGSVEEILEEGVGNGEWGRQAGCLSYWGD